MKTYFAPPEKADPEIIRAEIDFVSKNEIITGLLHSISGLLAVLDENRQILAVNDSFLQMLGLDDPAHALGLRPGEVLECPHAQEPPHGCGTTQYCATCGAAIAMVASLGSDKPVEKICALTTQKLGETEDVALLVRSQPIKLEGNTFLLLFLQDITQQQHLAAMERIFYHDINNILSLIVGASEMLTLDLTPELAHTVHQASLRLRNEIAIQRCLSQQKHQTYQPLWGQLTTDQVVEQLETFFGNHPLAANKQVEYQGPSSAVSFTTDLSLLLRILSNMVINALEATDRHGTVKLWIEDHGDYLSFSIWNARAIPGDIALRIFQRNFSTKNEPGRGLGTHSMKLFGENILGGKVSFTSSPSQGTVFRFDHPKKRGDVRY